MMPAVVCVLAAAEQAAIDWFADKDVPQMRGKFLSDTRYSPETARADVTCPLKGGGSLLVKPYPHNW